MGSSNPPPPHNQFPQPTRPRFAADPDQLSHENIFINKHVHHSIHHPHVTVDLPNTTTDPPPPPSPPKFTDTTISTSNSSTGKPQTLEPPPAFYPTIESSSSSAAAETGNRVIDLSPSTGQTPKGEREAVDELLFILVDCLDQMSTKSREALLMKFFSEIEGEDRLEKFIVDRLKQSKVQSLTDLYERIPQEIKEEANLMGDYQISTTTRSVVKSAEELTLKIERFRMNTLYFDDKPEEEAKEEEDKDKEKESKDKTTK